MFLQQAEAAQPWEADRHFMLRTYRTMVLIRSFEETVRSLASAGHVPGLVHLCSGQEATNAGVCLHLGRQDLIASHHRGHGHCLAKGMDIGALMAEILGRSTGACLGRGGSMHVYDRPNGILGTNGIVGGGIPLAAGAALAAKTLGTGQICVAFFGDGALNQGLVAECMNMAGLWSLPVVFVCENNGFGEYTAIEDVTAGKSLLARGQVYDIPSIEVDGMDVVAVGRAFCAAAGRARRGEGPSFLLCNTYRYGGHHAGDRQTYKDAEEIKLWQSRDPILKLRRQLLALSFATEGELAGGQKEAEQQVAVAVRAARDAPHVGPSLLRDYLHA